VTRSLRRILVLTSLVIAVFGGRMSLARHLQTTPPAEAASVIVTTDKEPLVQMVDGDDEHHGMWGDWDGWRWWLVMPVMLIFWGGVIWLIVWLVRQSSSRTDRSDGDAIEIARRRYARGEISREEFEQIRRDLSD
jgi:putative membrane protein